MPISAAVQLKIAADHAALGGSGLPYFFRAACRLNSTLEPAHWVQGFGQQLQGVVHGCASIGVQGIPPQRFGPARGCCRGKVPWQFARGAVLSPSRRALGARSSGSARSRPVSCGARSPQLPHFAQPSGLCRRAAVRLRRGRYRPRSTGGVWRGHCSGRSLSF